MDLANYHRFLLGWHTRKFYPIRRRLTRLEKDYLEVCFKLANRYSETSESGFSRFSYYSYSHRIKGDEINSSRLAYGSVTHPDQALAAAEPVISERGVELPEFFRDPNHRFYGLGWDLLEKQFKVYFRCLRVADLPPELASLVEGYSLSEHRDEGLVSFTYGPSGLEERKVYLYPRENTVSDEEVVGEARMVTDQRGEVPQYDLDPSAPDWLSKLCPEGQRIVALYYEVGEPLDTIAYHGPRDYTLYFP